ncbi:DUF4333 domain-containing protein [Gordonia sp. PP30]|uniref:DUF4333 domain-containing protein n=1 Tax=Gordonia sp. PP30 TaxID=2935861 RepID=UPI001FFF1EF2|nr:DUF4333 domain-containing protein [Gordonia sp. PP30]UQE74655.1 DUF4333 domain-containing protein [Gordonia sp. PP30]
MKKAIKGITLAGLVAAAVALSGCEAHVSVGDASTTTTLTAPVVSTEKLAEGVRDQLTETVGQTPDQVRCAGNLEARVGATQQCALESGGSWLPVTATVTAVEGTDVNYHIEVGKDEIPEPSY